MANISLGYLNRADTSTITSDQAITELPIENLQNEVVSRLAQFTSTSPITIETDFGRIYDINVVALIRHDISSEATVRVMFSNDADFTEVLYDESRQVFTENLSLPWEHPDWFFGATDESLRENYETIDFIHPLVRSVTARYMRIIINDVSNLNGFVRIGRLWAGPAWIPSKNFIFGAQLDWVTLSRFQQGRSGVRHYDRNRMIRRFSIGFDALNNEDAYRLFNIRRKLDISGQVLVVPDADDTNQAFERNFLATIEEADPLTQPYPFEYAQSLTLLEVA